ncbi:peptidoglycan-binding protein [Actinomadura barringtoniae]|uniref:Peptidoglycan-binding protein n=1 Tax=Actinomadura barringtoniae TaxID=1427535 RepID=A0A939TFP7_9ACTN|nr:peptidoglycan-binding protein [Actinomadura barringtoniae]MBO2454600.1 peptidoglycan-binding protein [Actinomadura barringtoniae]
MNRTRAAVLSAVGVAVVGGAGLATAGLGGGNEPAATHSSLPPATAKVERTTLVETKSVDGTIAYGGTSTATGAGHGTITWLASPGAVLHRGQSAYRIDNHPVPLVYGSLPLYRTLSTGTKGTDVEQFEENLAALGYSGFTVDKTYSSATADAVKRWQDDLGVTETGKIEPGAVMVVPEEIRIGDRKANVGDKVGGPVLTYTGTTRVVTVPLDVKYQRLVKKGRDVEIVLPDESTTKGTITKVGKVAKEGQGDNPTTIDVTVAVRRQRSLGNYDKAPVEVHFTSSRHADVLAVPIGALVAQAGGGYGVQVVENGTVRTVKVETGAFTGGQVEVSGDGLREGMSVGVPK